MTDTCDPREETKGAEIALEIELDAKPEKVWRAISLAAFRERMREDAAPLQESTVTFRIEPGPKGGALLRIIHRIDAGGRGETSNDNLHPVGLAA